MNDSTPNTATGSVVKQTYRAVYNTNMAARVKSLGVFKIRILYVRLWAYCFGIIFYE